MVDYARIAKKIVGEKPFCDDVTLDRARCNGMGHGGIECSRCVGACPTGALAFEQHDLSIHTGKCLHCGACIAVCPTQALFSEWLTFEDLAKAGFRATAKTKGYPTIACSKALDDAGMGDAMVGSGVVSMPCLARVDEALLMVLAAFGARRIRMVSGDCPSCNVGCSGSASSADDAFCADERDCEGATPRKTAMADAGAASFAWEQVACHVREMLAGVGSDVQVEVLQGFSGDGGITRRELFSSLRDEARNIASIAFEEALAESQYAVIAKALGLGSAKPALIQDGGRDIAGYSMDASEASRAQICQQAMVALALRGHATAESALHSIGDNRISSRIFGKIDVDVRKCNKCLLCVAYCKTHAIEKVLDDHRVVGLALHPNLCAQCGACTDVCKMDAINVGSEVRVSDIICEKANPATF